MGRIMKSPARIGITGGPAAGKSQVLQILKETYPEHRWYVPEVATWLGSMNIDMNTMMFEALCWNLQFDIENELFVKAKYWNDIDAIIYDRTMLDVLAYIKDGQDYLADSVRSNMRGIPCPELRYDAIIFLDSVIDESKIANNPYRKETTVEEVQAASNEIAEVIKKHHKIITIPIMSTIEEKAEKVNDAIRKIIEETDPNRYLW